MKLRRIKFLWVLAAALTTMATSRARAELLALYEGDKINTANELVVLDSSGNGNHGLLQGNASVTPDGHAGGSLLFPNEAGSNMVLNTSTVGAFDSITDNQSLTVAFWLSGGDQQGVQNQSVFWGQTLVDPADANTNRGFQAHVPWSNGQVYYDLGSCCTATQRVNGAIDSSLWRASDGEEWTHWAFTLEPEFGDAFVYANGEIVLERLGPTDEIREILQIWVGSAIDGGNFMDGRLDDFLIDDEALSQAQIIDLVDNGVRSVYPNIPAEPEEYVPTAPEGRLVNMNGKLAGAAFLDGAEIDSWRVEQIFHAMAGGMDVEAVADLSSAGVTGMGNVGDASTDVQLGDVDLVNTGADDETLEFRLVTTHSDPVLGPGAETVFSQTFDLAGSGGGTDPFVFLGDLDQDGMVQFSDFVIMAENFGAVKPPAGAPEVPEPSSSLLMLFAAGLLAPVVRRRGRE